MTTSLTVDDLSVRRGARQIIEGLCLKVPSGSITALVGPNGSGKSTLLKAVYGYLHSSGSVYLDAEDVTRMSPRLRARRMAVAAQDVPLDIDLSVSEVVTLGRIPHLGALKAETHDDREIVWDAMVRVGVDHLTDRPWTQLSGGERQSTLLARAVAQQGSLLILDEPTNHLDVRHQFELLDIVRDLKVTTVTAMHDLDLAMQFCDRIAVLQAGAIVTVGPPAEVLVDDIVSAVFNVHVDQVVNPRTGQTQLLFSRHENEGKGERE